MTSTARSPIDESRPTPHASRFPSFDAHNHLQDERFAGRQEELLAAAKAVGVEKMVVNGACESDWPKVAELARLHPEVIPSFGYHPWYLGERTARWQENLVRQLDANPGAKIGEIGLDRWMLENPERWRRYRGDAAPFIGQPPSRDDQEAVFTAQLDLAVRRNLPVSIHCLQAFGRLLELLESNPRPARGFLLHSYGGPAELIPAFANLGAYFSFPGSYLQERKARQREIFRRVPRNRLLVETDAPDQVPPPEFGSFTVAGLAAEPLNHPANLPAIQAGLAQFLGDAPESLALQLADNFSRLFGHFACLTAHNLGE